MDSTDSLGENVADLQDFQLGAGGQVLLLRHGVGRDDLVEGAGVDALDGVAGEDAVGDERVDGLRAFLLEELGGAGDGVGGVCQVVDEDGRAVAHFSDEQHAGVLAVVDLGGATLLRSC